ncbi:MAG: HAD hydrolase-like protein [Alphaproteobacteria bacterium]|nr:HAD hydrolase-like protein [Alphaproteobacteria bacterium]
MQYDLNIKDLKIVVFDWDNTLAESRTALVYAVNQVLQEYGLQDWEIEKQKRNNALSFKDNFVNIFGKNAQKAYEKYRNIYLQNVSKLITAFPKTHSVLQFFKDHNISLMIMSNKERILLEYELPLLFNPKLFDNVVCGHEAIKDKPFAEHLFWTLKDVILPNDISPESVWVVGDSPQDSRCAQNAGAQAIRIGSSIWQDEDENIDDVWFFDSFVDFYDSLLLSNPK